MVYPHLIKWVIRFAFIHEAMLNCLGTIFSILLIWHLNSFIFPAFDHNQFQIRYISLATYVPYNTVINTNSGWLTTIYVALLSKQNLSSRVRLS